MSDDAKPPALTEKQETYCQMVIGNSYADAYRAAYNPSPGYNFSADIWKLNRNPSVALRIRELQAAAAKNLKISREWLLEWWFLRMVYDPAEITAWAIDCCRYCHGVGGNYQWREGEYFDAIAKAEITKDPLPDCSGGFGFNSRNAPNPECARCDGRGVGRSDITDTRELSPAGRAGFEGIKETRNGIELKMADKHHAAEQFAKLSGWDVIQFKNIPADVPLEAELAAIANDPVALSAAYKAMFAPGGASKH